MIMIADIQRAVADHFKVPLSDMASDRRSVTYTRPRQVAMYLSRRLTTRSYPQIGRKFGDRDHATVIHGVRRIEELVRTDRKLGSAVRKIERALTVRESAALNEALTGWMA